MRAHTLVPKAMALSNPPMFRAVTSAKRRKFLLLHRLYGSSSKSAASNMPPSKFSNVFGLRSASENFLPAVWKSVEMASSVLNYLATSFATGKKEISTTKPSGEPNEENPAELQTTKAPIEDKRSEATVSSQKFISDERVPVIQKPSRLNEKSGNELEQSFFEWLAGSEKKTKGSEFFEDEEKKIEKIKKPLISKSSLQQRSRFLVSSLTDASSSGSQLIRLEEVCKHLLLYPEQKTIMCKAGLVRTCLRLKYEMSDKAIREQARCALALVGYHDPPKGDGIKILSIDGGGTRGIMAIEILRQLEATTGLRVHQLFDLVCGVSSGAILGLLLGGLHLTLDEVETMYRKLSNEVFQQSTIWGTGRLMWSHAYYDTTAWVNVLKKNFDEKLMIDSAKDKTSPKLAAVSALMNSPQLEAFVFRNYDFDPGVQSYYKGSCRYRMWEAVRASGAAPGYFEELRLDDYLHQDGGIMINNPTALAIHEAKLLWPSDYIQCVVSIGCGRYIPPSHPNLTSTNLKTKMLKVIDSATDTEAVHIALNDLLTPDTYFRINPYLTEFLNLDENREEKLDQMKRDAQMYLRRNEYKFSNAAKALTINRSYLKHAKDWLRFQKDYFL
ncbi:hypothetical protein JTE90_012071 [Oedothorax gibbosus]|uniref:PNPLA domain-containing protein n=1 Tax=Oedothorax gibbosus TaxID=931172 RepID=A0AAV6U650_9ARAC|nr:hypothetical protein JTE90_012071 [Oedothorax gibbosus]KAG8179374.1 hypothetical protein JTE90_012071 [Oedothorax gibbosus]